MKITKKLEAEILQVMDDYWSSYLTGDLPTWASYLPDDYRNIGTTKAEIWHSKKEIVEFTEMVLDQTVGMAETRNKKTHVIPYDPYVMVHELGDLYVKAEEGWVFYAQFRLSSLLKKTTDGWKVLHQHGSYPDSKSEEGEAFGFDELKAENKKLRDAIRARTVELEKKNQELEIEAALERVRAASMAMHHSEELHEVVLTVSEEIGKLGLNIHATHIYRFTGEESKDLHCWFAAGGGKYPYEVIWPYTKNKLFDGIYRSRMEGKTFFTESMGKKEKDRTIKHLLKSGNIKMPEERKKFLFAANGARYSLGLGVNSGIAMLRFEEKEFSPDENDVIKRFSKVFEQAYTRFLDLQKAEAQAREAEIEAALERIRSATMAMHKTEELANIVKVIFQQFQELGIEIFMVYVGIYIYSLKDKYVDQWFSPIEGIKDEPFYLKLPSTPWEDTTIKEWRAGKEMGYVSIQGTQAIMEYAKAMDTMANWNIFESMVNKFSVEILEQTEANHQYGNLGIVQDRKATKKEKVILKRFAKVFEQTYTRFLDLVKAENQAKEARKQAALDRVRGEIASMRSTEDLNRITPVIWRELIALDVPFIRCGVFIVNEDTEIVEVYLTTPEGKALGVLQLPFDVNSQTTNTVKYWRKKEVYREHWDAQAFTEWTQSMIEMGQVKNFADYQGAAKIPDALHLHFVPFKQGMLYVGDVNPLPYEKIELVKTLAEAFAIAYARYEDFVRLEQAKSEVEGALAELKSAQAQLIQSEKMASLGELTAGIAHEIQNPLNFVNNFSELNTELLEELEEEIAQGDLEEIQAIAKDLKLNEQKINHHGQRADAIVKGMLQHSRQSTSEKTLTDINNLADEYLRLAYHGLRAKDKSFNAVLNTDFDPALEPIMVIPQDIGRVMLNLITNAFYAVQEKKKSNETTHQSTVLISTKKTSDDVIITVKDNGIGMPQQILEKVFQPFFTTKPTGQGTGLGLSLSYDIIKAHEGKLEVETEEGAYTIFRIILPNKK